MTEDATIRKYLAKLQPHSRDLFRMAHAVTGNAELAEYALASAIRSAYLSMGEDMPFRDSVRHAVIEQAFAKLSRRNPEEYPPDFSCFELSADGGDEIGAWLAGEKPEVRRLLFLRYGCGLGAGDAGRVLGISRQAARRQMAAAQANFGRAMGALPFDRSMVRAARREMSRSDVPMPDMGTLFRTFEADLRNAEKPRVSARKIVRILVCMLCMLVLAAAFWVFAAITAYPAADGTESITQESAEELT